MEVDDLDYFWTTSVLLAAVLLKYTHKYTPYVYVASGNIWDPALLTDIVTKLSLSLSLSPHIYIYIYIHRYVYIHIHVYICIPVYITYSWEEKLPHKQTNRINKRTNDQDIVLWPRTQSFAEKWCLACWGGSSFHEPFTQTSPWQEPELNTNGHWHPCTASVGKHGPCNCVAADVTLYLGQARLFSTVLKQGLPTYLHGKFQTHDWANADTTLHCLRTSQRAPTNSQKQQASG